MLADEPKLTFLFIGAGSGYGILRAAIAERLENVVFRPYQDRASCASACARPPSRDPAARMGGLVMPSKLYGALAAGRRSCSSGAPRATPRASSAPARAWSRTPKKCRRWPRRSGRCAALRRASRDGRRRPRHLRRLSQRRQPRRLDPLPARRRPRRDGAPTAPAGGGGMSSAAAHRRITGVDLARYEPVIPGNRSVAGGSPGTS